MARRNPVRLNIGSMSGRVVALTNYRVVRNGNRTTNKVIGDGKHDVHDDFVSLLLEMVLGKDIDTLPILGRLSKTEPLTEDEHAVIDRFLGRMERVVDDYNAACQRRGVEQEEEVPASAT
jgi:hypothetical protein